MHPHTCFIAISCCRSLTTVLGYEVNVIPRFNFPAIFLERIIGSDLPVNLQALACRSESKFQGNQNVVLLNASSSTLEAPPMNVKASFSPLSGTVELNTSNWGILGKSCPLDRPCVVDEVHLRRFDGLLVGPFSPFCSRRMFV